MPEFFDVVRSQRGTAYYRPDPVPDDVLQQILEAATRAPSGSNRQPWRFIVLRDREVKRRMGELYLEAQGRMTGGTSASAPGETPAHFSGAMEDVPVLVMCCVERWKMRGSESYRGASIYPAAQNLMLAAAAFGLGTRLTTVWQHCYEDVAALLGVPDDWEMMALIPIGYPAPPDHLGGSRRKPVSEVTFYDRWGNAVP